jgi:hypothetical protein
MSTPANTNSNTPPTSQSTLFTIKGQEVSEGEGFSEDELFNELFSEDEEFSENDTEDEEVNDSNTPPTAPSSNHFTTEEGQGDAASETPLTKTERYHSYAQFGLELVASWRLAINSDPVKHAEARARWNFDNNNFKRMKADLKANGSDEKLDEIVKRITRMYHLIAAHLDEDI